LKKKNLEKKIKKKKMFDFFSRLVGDCVMTRNSFFLVRYFFKAWFFGACYYWLSWGILLMYVVGLIHSVIQKNRSAADDAEDDYDELQ
jgi:hypothetical protein